jgi:hypothetical protein
VASNVDSGASFAGGSQPLSSARVIKLDASVQK